MKKILLIVGAAVLTIIFLGLGFMVWNYHKIQTGDLVKWDNQWYTKEELKTKFPPQVYEVESKNTPEEVYTAFRQALLDNDLEKALSFIVEKNREEYKENFLDITKLEKYKLIPEVEKIIKSEKNSSENYSNYYFYMDKSSDSRPYEIDFLKSQEGFWEIERI